MQIKSPDHVYRLGKLVAEAPAYRLYLCKQEGTGRECLLQVAASAVDNGTLDRAAFVLKELERRADELEAEYAKVRTDPNVLLNYGLGFPELVESFIFEEQNGRRINILAFRCVDDVHRMVPLGNIVRKDELRVDLRTSAWIMGKALKLLAFAHGERISVGRIDDTNILIEPDQHYVLFFDWSHAELHPDVVPTVTRRTEIAQAAQAVIKVIARDHSDGTGGSSSSELGMTMERWMAQDLVDSSVIGIKPLDGLEGQMSLAEARSVYADYEKERPYADFLVHLADGGERDAEQAHERFYKLIDGIWERKFYPFTTISV